MVDNETVTPTEEAKAPSKGKAPAKPKGVVPLDIEHRYTLEAIDKTVGDIEEFDIIRSAAVDEQLSFLEALTDPLEERLQETVYKWMKDPSTNPYRSKELSLPNNLSTVSLAEMQDRLGLAMNALYVFAELRSIVAAVAQARTTLFERRKHHALINEGRNEAERKALSYLRADPEYLLYNNIMMAKEWIEPRYFSIGRIVEALNDAVKTKSVEASREQKDRQAEYNQS